MSFRTVFDVSQQGFQTWHMIGIGLILTISGAFLVFRPEFMAFLLPTGPQGNIRAIFSKIFFGFALFWTACVSTITIVGYLRARYDLSHGYYSVVEGPVTQFEAGGAHRMESFSVHGVRFTYVDGEETSGFHTSVAYGGPIREGVWVRVTYKANLILRLEVANGANAQ